MEYSTGWFAEGGVGLVTPFSYSSSAGRRGEA